MIELQSAEAAYDLARQALAEAQTHYKQLRDAIDANPKPTREEVNACGEAAREWDRVGARYRQSLKTLQAVRGVEMVKRFRNGGRR